MSDARYYVAWYLNPVRFAACGVVYDDDTTNPTEYSSGNADGWKWITRGEFDALADSAEPSQIIAGWLGLSYQKFLEPDPGSQVNVVELIASGDDSAFDQPCRFGHRVEGHAVYCHNSRWIDSPRKCRRTWYTGGRIRDEDCPGFEPNPRAVAPSEAQAPKELSPTTSLPHLSGETRK